MADARFEAQVLKFLAKAVRGYTTADIAWRIVKAPNATTSQHSAYVLSQMKDMERRGLVKRLYGGTPPIVWALPSTGDAHA